MKLSLPLAISLLLPASLGAQTQTFLVSPKHAFSGGNSNNLYPLGAAPMRYMQVHDAGSFDKVNPVGINQIYHRMAKGWDNGTRGGQTVELAMWLSYAATGIDSQTASTTYASNQDTASLKQVIKKTKIVLPILKDMSWGIKLPFDSGATFLYGAVLKRHLVSETRVYGNSNSNSQISYPMDANSGSAGSPTGTVAQNGTFAGCKSSNAAGSIVQHNSFAATLVVGNQSNSHQGYGYVQSAPAVMILGASPLAITLPGTSCTLVNDILVLGVGQTDTSSNGVYNQPLPIPNDNTLTDVSYLTQMAFLDVKANSFGLTLTRGLKNTIGAPTVGNVIRLWAFGANPDSITTATGTQKNYGLVTQFSN
ncbi:MAG: hypothetical protein R3F30_03085 [Planctomycetota bacterium]